MKTKNVAHTSETYLFSSDQKFSFNTEILQLTLQKVDQQKKRKKHKKNIKKNITIMHLKIAHEKFIKLQQQKMKHSNE